MKSIQCFQQAIAFSPSNCYQKFYDVNDVNVAKTNILVYSISSAVILFRIVKGIAQRQKKRQKVRKDNR